MLRRMMVLSLALLLVGTLIVAACGPAPQPTATSAPEVKLRAAFVLFGTHDDGTWNAMAWEGMQRLKDMGYETAYTENVSDADAARVMRNYATEGYNLIWAHSGTYPNAVMEVAPDFPDVTFAAITGPGLEWPPNVWQVSHEWEDAYFLAGAMAGLMTKTGTVGQVGAVPIPIYAASMQAFNQGVVYVKPDAKTFDPVFIGDFNDSAGAKQAAQAQIENGADIILSSLDAGVFGLIEAAREANQAGGNVHIMTILSDLYDQAPDVALSSAYMDYPGAVVAVAEKVLAGEKGGYYPMRWSNGTARWADLHGNVSDDVMNQLKTIEADIMAGKIDVFTQADLPQP
jgi:basic membrane protein A